MSIQSRRLLPPPFIASVVNDSRSRQAAHAASNTASRFATRHSMNKTPLPTLVTRYDKYSGPTDKYGHFSTGAYVLSKLPSTSVLRSDGFTLIGIPKPNHVPDPPTCRFAVTPCFHRPSTALFAGQRLFLSVPPRVPPPHHPSCPFPLPLFIVPCP